MVNRGLKRKIRHKRVRKNISGTTQVPRLNVFRSNKAIYAQIIDDTRHMTLAAASSKELKKTTNNVEVSKLVGEAIAKKAKAAGIKKVVFDRGGYLYHGKVKALADGAREKGLEF